MFGHDDQSQQQHQAEPDNTFTTDDGQVLNPPQATPVDDTAGDFIETDSPTAPPAPVTAAPAVLPDTPAAPSHPNTDQLLDIKQQALQQLTPLVGHLEQNPEEKFRTTMMMIQASDNDALIKDAYEAALQIHDEKVRAQALLDIVNEINYFTHSDANPET
jgi:hypothetical protein